MRRPLRLQQLLRFDQKLRRQLRLKNGLLAGVDEAGRGPLAGPVLAAAVILREVPAGVSVDDSKRLTPRARERAFRRIVECAHVGVGFTSPEEIDRIGIRLATAQAMVEAVERLQITPRWVLVDGRDSLPRWTTPSFVQRGRPGCPVSILPVVGGDAKSLVIACASIVAKVVRDRWMGWVDRFHPEYGFRRHKGYGTPEHLRVLQAVGPSLFHRYSFRPILQ